MTYIFYRYPARSLKKPAGNFLDHPLPLVYNRVKFLSHIYKRVKFLSLARDKNLSDSKQKPA